jgi:hypothetical protein
MDIPSGEAHGGDDLSHEMAIPGLVNKEKTI